MKRHKSPANFIEEEIRKNPHKEYSITKVMEKYAKQQALAFHEWAESNCYIESYSNPGYYYRIVGELLLSKNELYRKFKQQQK